MFRRILVPVDFTPRSRRAVGVAARIAAAAEADDDAAARDRAYRCGRARSLRRLLPQARAECPPKDGRSARRVSKRGLEARGEVLYGGRVNEILQFAGGEAGRSHRDELAQTPVRHAGENWGNDQLQGRDPVAVPRLARQVRRARDRMWPAAAGAAVFGLRRGAVSPHTSSPRWSGRVFRRSPQCSTRARDRQSAGACSALISGGAQGRRLGGRRAGRP